MSTLPTELRARTYALLGSFTNPQPDLPGAVSLACDLLVAGEDDTSVTEVAIQNAANWDHREAHGAIRAMLNALGFDPELPGVPAAMSRDVLNLIVSGEMNPTAGMNALQQICRTYSSAELNELADRVWTSPAYAHANEPGGVERIEAFIREEAARTLNTL